MSDISRVLWTDPLTELRIARRILMQEHGIQPIGIEIPEEALPRLRSDRALKAVVAPDELVTDITLAKGLCEVLDLALAWTAPGQGDPSLWGKGIAGLRAYSPGASVLWSMSWEVTD